MRKTVLFKRKPARCRPQPSDFRSMRERCSSQAFERSLGRKRFCLVAREAPGRSSRCGHIQSIVNDKGFGGVRLPKMTSADFQRIPTIAIVGATISYVLSPLRVDHPYRIVASLANEHKFHLLAFCVTRLHHSSLTFEWSVCRRDT